MPAPKRLVVTDEHLKLLDRTYISYDEWTEFGAPCVDPKRPYGNSDVIGDMVEILGLADARDADDWGYTDEAQEHCNRLHREMQYVLQILVRQRSIELGTYVLPDGYGVNWVKEGE